MAAMAESRSSTVAIRGCQALSGLRTEAMSSMRSVAGEKDKLPISHKQPISPRAMRASQQLGYLGKSRTLRRQLQHLEFGGASMRRASCLIAGLSGRSPWRLLTSSQVWRHRQIFGRNLRSPLLGALIVSTIEFLSLGEQCFFCSFACCLLPVHTKWKLRYISHVINMSCISRDYPGETTGIMNIPV